MRALVSFILAILYTTLSFGVNINLHLCHNELTKVHFSKDVNDISCHEHHDCGSSLPGEKENTFSCCSHEAYLLKIDDFNAPVDTDKQICPMAFQELTWQYEFPAGTIEINLYSFVPPVNIPLYLKENRFTLYG